MNGTKYVEFQKFRVSGHVADGATNEDPLVCDMMVNELHVVSACIPWFLRKLESMMHIKYSRCFLIVLCKLIGVFLHKKARSSFQDSSLGPRRVIWTKTCSGSLE